MLKRTLDYIFGEQRYFLLLAVFVVFVAILLRNAGIYPVVFADEYYYSKLSRLQPLADASIPDYLYLAIYRATSLVGSRFLEGARVLNALFFVAATPFIYLAARRVCTQRVASIVALLALLGPINSYTAYFMPESLYFFSFWLFTWFILRLQNSSTSRSWCLAGILLGLSALIKPHALFLLPAIAAYIVCVTRTRGGTWIFLALRNSGLVVVFTLLTKLLIGYCFAGKTGVTLFGSFYGATATSAAANPGRCFEILVLSAQSLAGHVLAMCLMFGVPIVFAFTTLLEPRVSNLETEACRISLYAILVLASLIAVASLFTASAANSGPYETAWRLHMRYYDFAFPLLLIIAAGQISLQSNAGTWKWRAIAAFPIAVAIIYAACTRLVPFTPGICDCPELHGFTADRIVFLILSGMAFLALGLGVFSVRDGARAFVFCLMPMVVGFSSFYVSRELRNHSEPDVFDRAGIYASDSLSNDELSTLTVVGSEPAGLYKSLFHLDSPQVCLKIIPEEADYNLAGLPPGRESALVMGVHAVRGRFSTRSTEDGFTLVRR